MDNTTITIEGVEYDRAKLTVEQNYFIDQLHDIDAQVKQTRFKFDQLNAARATYTNQLMNSLKTDEDVEKTTESAE